ncbi:MAG: formate dehydrogenase accessory sulfurtransferase FdhD [Labilithrix sp.]|nr:formate dehydrogenase accessory sulfurtransferase FdhD [Labilithrix sp.]MCW5810010.1 formate dehydrogenase accessory sulfurtransferase FdhD [Labilithrix sp.]
MRADEDRLDVVRAEERDGARDDRGGAVGRGEEALRDAAEARRGAAYEDAAERSRHARYDSAVAAKTITVERVRSGARAAEEDRVVVEEPLEIRVDDDTLAITMRTPGHDRELVLGFLLGEGIIRAKGDVASLANCGRPGDPGYANTIAVVLGPTARPPESERVRRGTMTTSACGVCGRRTLDDLFARIQPRRSEARFSAEAIAAAVAALRERQPLFDATGGCHAAALTDAAALEEAGPRAVVAALEDVGRHNAVDKVVGSRVLAGDLGVAGRLLVVSGRASFEIVQKALAAGVDAVASVSAPSSLAVDLAREGGLVLAGFVRGSDLVVYSGAERVD